MSGPLSLHLLTEDAQKCWEMSCMLCRWSGHQKATKKRSFKTPLNGVNKLRNHQLRWILSNTPSKFIQTKYWFSLLDTREFWDRPKQIEAIMELHPPKNLWEFRKLQGIYAYIQSFILNLSGRCRPFSGLMNKGLDFWIGWVMPKCARKYQIISHKTPNFSQPNKKGNPSYCTLRPWQSLGAVFGTREHHTENNILFKSNLRRYSLTGKVCLTLIFAIQKLQHYLQYYSIKLISKANPFYPKSDDSKWSICKMGSI